MTELFDNKNQIRSVCDEHRREWVGMGLAGVGKLANLGQNVTIFLAPFLI